MSTLDLNVEVRHVTEEEAKAIEHAVSDAVAGVVGRAPNWVATLKPDFDGPGRTVEEVRRAAAEGRR